MNPFTDALDALTVALQTIAGSVVVSRDPSVIGPNVAASNLAVLVSPGVVSEPSSYRTWFVDTPIHICFPSPGEPRHVDPAYGLAHDLMSSDYEFVSMEHSTVQLDSATALPAITVTLRLSTDC